MDGSPALAAPIQSAAERRTAMMLGAPVFATLCQLALPNMMMMSSQAIANFLESYFVGLLGVAELAGVALVFPLIMLMQMLSAGAIGGGISSAVARALGAGRRADADALVVHALVVNLGLGVVTSAIFLAFGRPIYAAMGGEGASLEAALASARSAPCRPRSRSRSRPRSSARTAGPTPSPATAPARASSTC